MSRLTAYSAIATSLALRSDHQVKDLLDKAVPLGSGIGGRSAQREVAGTWVFVKRVPVSEQELLPENHRSTANIFGLPPFFQSGQQLGLLGLELLLRQYAGIAQLTELGDQFGHLHARSSRSARGFRGA